MDLNNVLETAEIQLATDSEQIQRCYQIIQQLRPHLICERAFIAQIRRQIQEGYRLAYIQEHGQVKALAGFRFLEFLAWGKILYIDDLITDVATRRNGYGSQLLKWVKAEAERAKCDQIHLDSGPQRHDAHRLYLNYGFKIIGHHFALDLKNPILHS